MTNIDDIASAIVDELAAYTNEVKEEVENAKREIAKKSVKKLKETSRKLSGEYAKGWRVKKDGDALIIHNKKYQLTHLLEKGHANRDGTGRTQAFPHIRPVERKAVEEFTERVEQVIRG